MSYYMRGDYYRGDYYRGDPGPFTFIEKAVKGVARSVVPGFAGIEGAVRSLISKPKAAVQVAPITPVTPPQFQGPMIQLPGGIKAGINLPQGIRGLFPSLSEVGPAAGSCPKGFKLNKSDYFLKDGTYVPAMSRCVRYRSMNPLNPRALRRGLRRAEGFERIARRTVNALRSGPKKFKSKGRKR